MKVYRKVREKGKKEEVCLVLSSPKGVWQVSGRDRSSWSLWLKTKTGNTEKRAAHPKTSRLHCRQRLQYQDVAAGLLGSEASGLTADLTARHNPGERLEFNPEARTQSATKRLMSYTQALPQFLHSKASH